MTKDRINYRLSKKQAHGGEEVERSIGITCTRHAGSGTLPRPVALLKWAFDDYIVEEELPAEVFVDAAPSSHTSAAAVEEADEVSAQSGSVTDISFVVQVLSEGVPDTVVEKLLRERLPRSIAFHFLTPVDFVSCASRYVWLRCGAEEAHTLPRAFWRDQHWHTSSGDIFVSPLRRIHVSAKAVTFPLDLLPRTRYTVTLRNIQCSLGDVLPQLRSVAQRGFLNYAHVARHGVGLAHVYEDAKLLLQRDYPAFLRHHVQRLSEGTTHVRREMPLLQEVLASARSTRQDWKGVLSGIELAVKNDAQVYGRARQSGLYPPHHDLLVDFVGRAADLLPRHHDSAQLLREAVKPSVLQETLRAVADVHFNAMASLRWQQQQQQGVESVVVGDVVCVRPDSAAAAATVRGAVDSFAGSADHINGFMTSSAHSLWSSAEGKGGSTKASCCVKRVASRAEAASYTIHDVVLPTFGRGSEELLASLGGSSPEADLFANLVRELGVEGLTEMHLAPPAALRPLLQVPTNASFYLVDEKRGWDWVEDSGAAALKAALRHDQDGILRYRSPFARRTQKNVVARAGIRADVARNFFLKPARKPGMTCVLQMTLPAGAHATSAIREAFTVATLSPSSIFNLLAR